MNTIKLETIREDDLVFKVSSPTNIDNIETEMLFIVSRSDIEKIIQWSLERFSCVFERR